MRTNRLQDQATEFLRANGYTWAGRPKKEVENIGAQQFAFERRVVHTPIGGDTRKWRLRH